MRTLRRRALAKAGGYKLRVKGENYEMSSTLSMWIHDPMFNTPAERDRQIRYMMAVLGPYSKYKALKTKPRAIEREEIQ